MRAFHSLSEKQILALTISLDEEDERMYADYAEGLRTSYRPRQRFLTGCAKKLFL